VKLAELKMEMELDARVDEAIHRIIERGETLTFDAVREEVKLSLSYKEFEYLVTQGRMLLLLSSSQEMN
jgi:hypothetical protein